MAQAEIDRMLRSSRIETDALAEALMRGYFHAMLRLCVSILNDPHDASDAAQEAIVDAVLHIDRYEPGTNLRAWLSRIAVFKCYGILRREHLRQKIQNTFRLVQSRNSTPPRLSEAASREEDLEALYSAIEKLSPVNRIAITLRYLNGLSISEIADLLEVPEGTVRSRLHYGLRDLRRWTSG